MQSRPRPGVARPQATDLARPSVLQPASAGRRRQQHQHQQLKQQQQRPRRRRSALAAGGGGVSSSSSEAQAPPTAAPAPALQPQHHHRGHPTRLRLFYETGWPSAVLHGSVRGSGWRDWPLQPVAASGGRFLAGDIELGDGGGNGNSSSSGAPLLEFVVRDASGQQWDKPPEGEGNYVVSTATAAAAAAAAAAAHSSAQASSTAALVLRGGALSPSVSPPAAPPGVLLVTDLDGTMIGQDDGATARLRDWWARESVPRGGVLCFNTGRPLPSVLRLLEQEKRGVLAHPDVVVSAVGTRVYWHERATPAAGGGRAGFPTTGSSSSGSHGSHGNGNGNGSSSSSSSGGFVEDAAWAAELEGGGWDAATAREAAYAALARAGREAMHFLPPEDQGPLKISCGVRDDALSAVLEDLREGMARRRGALEAAQVIVSGHGGWRFVDVVPKTAGKLAALEHVRAAGGFAPGQTVAAGDSGNDVAMLAGRSNLAVVVGNAQPDAARWAEEQQAIERAEAEAAGGGGGGGGSGAGKRQRLYRASGREAAGILEALEYWGLFGG